MVECEERTYPLRDSRAPGRLRRPDLDGRGSGSGVPQLSGWLRLRQRRVRARARPASGAVCRARRVPPGRSVRQRQVHERALSGHRVRHVPLVQSAERRVSGDRHRRLRRRHARLPIGRPMCLRLCVSRRSMLDRALRHRRLPRRRLRRVDRRLRGVRARGPPLLHRPHGLRPVVTVPLRSLPSRPVRPGILSRPGHVRRGLVRD
jgi:hypothetical protein